MVTAPYNFVSLPPNAVTAPFATDNWNELTDADKQEKYAAYVEAQGKNTGFFELTIKTLSPCFINTANKAGEDPNTPKTFFRVGDHYLIAGSSLRGMVKNICKIIAAGAMRPGEDIEDKRLYYRSRNGKNERNESGFLIKTDMNEYYICPAKKEEEKNSYKDKRKQLQVDNWGNKTNLTGGSFRDIRYCYSIYRTDFGSGNRLYVPQEVIEGYAGDLQRADDFDLLNLTGAKTGKAAAEFTGQNDIIYVVPCFYDVEGDLVKSFGHCRHYRVPYRYSIGEFVPEAVQKSPVDLVDAIFGCKNLWASRVFFEDAIAEGEPQACGSEMPRPLAKPNPTSYQLYLKQTGFKDANKWDNCPDDAQNSLRGYKLYWHNNKSNAWYDVNKKSEDAALKGMRKITPLAAGTIFRGCLRFENLSDIELGILCSVFNMGKPGQKITYKIGQGKSIGLGSISIKTDLFLEKDSEQYKQLFASDNSGWQQEFIKGNIDDFKPIFEQYRDANLTDKIKFDTSLAELTTLLDFNQTLSKNWSDKIATMDATSKEDQRFKKHLPLLPTLDFYKADFH